jgi:hypothetical protein
MKRKIRGVLTRGENYLAKNQPHLKLDYSGQAAGDLIRETLERGAPCMVCRFGKVEMETLLTYLITGKKFYPSKFLLSLKGGSFTWNERIRSSMSNNAGFFPTDDASLAEFCRLYLADMRQIDILGSWLHGEVAFSRYFDSAKIIPLPDIEPYYHERPWSEVLSGKKVLVVSPFARSIAQQFSDNRTRLFANPNMLPEFSLETLQAVQTIAGNGSNSGFADWFEALSWMKEKIDSLDYDVVIVGAGAYGLPLAAHAKRTGKMAIHLGGATQILFGIKGKRWDGIPLIKSLYNEHWINPSPEEIPENFNKVEGGCYW